MKIIKCLIFIDILSLIFLAFSIATLIKYNSNLDLTYTFLMSVNCIIPVVIIVISSLLWYYANNFIKITEPQNKKQDTINKLIGEIKRLTVELNDYKTTENRTIHSRVIP